MKPSKIQRGIQSRHARESGDLPPLGRVVRMRDSQAGHAKSSQGGYGNAGLALKNAARRRTVLLWSVGSSLATLAVVAGFMVFWMRSHRTSGGPMDTAPRLGNVKIASKFPSPSEEEALQLVEQAMAIRDPGKVETYFRLGTADAGRVIEFLKGTAARDGRILSSQWQGSMDVEGLLLDGVLIHYSGKQRPVERLVFLTPDDKGVWKIDFDAFARTSVPTWEDLLGKRVDHAQVRVMIAPDVYYNGPFVDETKWICFGMASPESNEILTEDTSLLRGYCRVASAQEKALKRMFAGGDRTRRAILEIGRVANSESRQFEIKRVLEEDWVLTSKAYDERADAAESIPAPRKIP
jgi:hypothetical protein